MLLSLTAWSGCHSYMLDEAQYELRDSYASGDMKKASAFLSDRGNELYREKEAVLWGLENGMVQRFSGNYDSSTVFLNNAEKAIEDNYAKSVSRGFLSVLSNDNKLVYDGEPYEDIYLNAFKALNYIHLNDWEASLVETRRMTYKIEQLDIRLKGLAKAFSQDTSTADIDWNTDNVNIQSSALSHYLATVLYSKSGKPDDARIEFTRLQRAIRTQSELFEYPEYDSSQLEYLKEPDSYNVLIAGFTGQAPVKESMDFRFIADDEFIKFSVPAIYLYPTQVAAVRLISDDSEPVYLDLIEEMDLIAKEVYDAKLPVIKGRAIARALVKKGGLNAIERRIKKENESASLVAGILGIIYQETSEKADLRGWQTMPGQAWMKAIWLPAGEHNIEIEYLDAEGSVLKSEFRQISVDQSTELSLIETLYSN